jgi:sirohydrochlorin cobaltochelatase
MSPKADTTRVVMVGHGSRSPEGTRQFVDFVQSYQNCRPDLSVTFGFIELADPPIYEVLVEAARLHRQLVVVPLSLLTAGHVKNELPLLLAKLRKEYPHCSVHMTPALGVNPILISAIVDQSLTNLRVSCRSFAKGEDTLLIAVGRGSSDPDANGDFFKIARLVGEAANIRRVLPCYIGITDPQVDETLELAARLRPKQIIVVPYFLFAGVLLKRLEDKIQDFAQKHPWIKALMLPRLAHDTQIFKALDERIDQAISGQSDPLPCVSCQYRTPLGTITEKVGGLTALLWSVRHSLTHAETGPHVHAHKPLKKHILVCTNTECADRGGIRVLQKFRSLLRAQNKQKTLQVTRTSCMGRCGEGPTVVVYPDGIWYRGVGEKEVDEIVSQHLLGGRLVSHCIDQIMVGD